MCQMKCGTLLLSRLTGLKALSHTLVELNRGIAALDDNAYDLSMRTVILFRIKYSADSRAPCLKAPSITLLIISKQFVSISRIRPSFKIVQTVISCSKSAEFLFTTQYERKHLWPWLQFAVLGEEQQYFLAFKRHSSGLNFMSGPTRQSTLWNMDRSYKCQP